MRHLYAEHIEDRAGDLGDALVFVRFQYQSDCQFRQRAKARFAFAQFGRPFQHRLFQQFV